MDYIKILTDLCRDLIEDKDNLKVVERESLVEDETVFYVYASKNDVSRLIGKRGSMASAIRQIMSVPSRLENKRVLIKFESYDE